MKVITKTPIMFWKNSKDIDKKEREFIKEGEILTVTKKVYERLADYVDEVKEETEESNEESNEGE
ncbi:MAG: hypothetical protein ACK5LC_03225 [Coprobacillaceae bacterium]